MGAEDLATPCGAIHHLVVLRIERNGHHRTLRRDIVVKARPRLAHVVAAVKGAITTAGGRAERRVEHVGILWGHLHIASVGQRGETAHFHIAPRIALIRTAK